MPPHQDQLGFTWPWLNFDVIMAGAQHYKQVLSVVVPLELLVLVNNMASLESAASAGETFSLPQSLAFDAIATLSSALVEKRNMKKRDTNKEK